MDYVNALVKKDSKSHAVFHQRNALPTSFAKRSGRRGCLGCGAGMKERWLMKLIDVIRFDL